MLFLISTNTCYVLESDQNFFSASIAVPADQYFIGNYEAFGYYRVNYDEENWNRIVTQLNDNYAVGIF